MPLINCLFMSLSYFWFGSQKSNLIVSVPVSASSLSFDHIALALRPKCYAILYCILLYIVHVVACNY